MTPARRVVIYRLNPGCRRRPHELKEASVVQALAREGSLPQLEVTELLGRQKAARAASSRDARKAQHRSASGPSPGDATESNNIRRGELNCPQLDITNRELLM